MLHAVKDLQLFFGVLSVQFEYTLLTCLSYCILLFSSCHSRCSSSHPGGGPPRTGGGNSGSGGGGGQKEEDEKNWSASLPSLSTGHHTG